MKRFLVLTLLVLLPPILYVLGLTYGLPTVMDIIAVGDCTKTPDAFTNSPAVCVDRVDYAPNPLGIVYAGVMTLPFVAGIAIITHSLFHRVMQKHV